MSRTLLAMLFALAWSTCATTERSSAEQGEPARPSEAVSQSSAVAAQKAGAAEAKPRAEPAASDPELESLRGLLDQAHKAKEDKRIAHLDVDDMPRAVAFDEIGAALEAVARTVCEYRVLLTAHSPDFEPRFVGNWTRTLDRLFGQR
jgi:hypothetical protein